MTLEQQVHKLEMRVCELERHILKLIPGRQAAQYVPEPDPRLMQEVIDKIKLSKAQEGA